MTTRVSRNDCIYAMSPQHPAVVRVAVGSPVQVETFDCFTNQIRSADDKLDALDWSHINPATGPIYVEGAEPGDVLQVQILDIAVEDQAVTCVVPGSGSLPDRIARSAHKVMQIAGGFVHFDDQVKLPVRTMIGVIGTAPADRAIATGTPDAHGGNMDCREIRPGATLYLPVNVPGALLALGDLHATMGDGEVCVSGAEVNGVVSLQLNVLKQCDLPTPFLVNAENAMAIYSAVDLTDAVKGSIARMADFIVQRTGRDFGEVLMLLSLAGNARICQIVDPQMTARMEVPLSVLADLGIHFE